MKKQIDLKIMIDRRKQKGLNQTDMARFFGLDKQHSRRTVAGWEKLSDEEIVKPSEHHRAKMIEYLSDQLGMKETPDELFSLWEVFQSRWGWNELSDVEKKSIVGTLKTETVDWERITPEELLARINSKDPGRSSSAMRAAIGMIDQGKLTLRFLIGANHAPYWLVKKLALEYLVNHAGEETLDILRNFRSTSYHVSQTIIRDFIDDRLPAKSTTKEWLMMAEDIMLGLSQAPKVTEISRGKDLKLLEKIRGLLRK